MKVIALKYFVLDTPYQKDKEYEMEKSVAQRLIKNGFVAAIEKEVKKATKKK